MKTGTNIVNICALLLVLISFSCSDQKDLPVVVKPQPEKFRLVRVTSGAENAQTYFYNTEDLLSRFTSHWLYQNTTGELNQLIDYDSVNRVKKIISNGVNEIHFFYLGRILDKTEEYDHRNRLAVTHYYLFSNENRLLELLDKVNGDYGSDSDYFIKSRYEYDQNGNVILIRMYTSKAIGEKFVLWREIQYDDYDDKINIDPGFVNYPFVEGKCTQRNNPGKITIKDVKIQCIVSVQQNSYTYNEQGYPVYKVEKLTSSGAQTETALAYNYERY